ncbi:efflux RND transporter permease subunit [Desulfurivibrio alkaliphilus]|uniref:Acriflavin resistance protein n=1 Tax=Desulfurivibrio alkaliphilus (strain DSM 19089 / UNIQEM U267 / AHT2) TaxID=589865 RepID=D6Z649_DESAT|nr:efflux RND transporter permease subunit [Desulfurivibrio alkaliphilus]ADH86814.1 acriflavin resistance protein [Desulfurivibrio alkaliphilus AHT 2]
MNSLPRWLLGHRHAVLAALIAVLIFGLDARLQLPVQLFPDTDPPMVTVITPYPGMAAEEVAENISKLMEEEFAGIDGVRTLRSTSREGLAVVEVEFHYGFSSTIGAMEVQNAVNRIRPQLPAAMGDPQIQEFSSAQRPIVTLALTSEELSLPQLRQLAENRVQDRLNLIDGVAAVDVVGGNRLQLEVQLQRDRMAAYGLSQEQVINALQGWNLTAAGGRSREGGRETVVRFDTPLRDAADAAALVLQRQDENLLLLGDVARVRLTPGEDRAAFHYNGQPAIAVQVLKRSEANTVAVADRVFTLLQELQAEEPAVSFAVAEDDSAFTRVVITSMTATIAGAIGLTMLVVLLFLGSFRQALVVAATIPVTFLATFALMRLAGLQLDMVTMSAIILAIGLLVDDSIVILENIHRQREAGLAPEAAAIEGTGEVTAAKIGGTVTTLAVLLPLTLLGGFIGELFRPLALTLSFALASSLVAALTLVPLLAVIIFGQQGGGGKKQPAVSDHLLSAPRQLYLQLLTVAGRRPAVTFILAFVLLLAGLGLIRAGGSEMMPRFDSGSFRVLLDVIPGTPLGETRQIVAAVEAKILAEAAVETVSTRIGYETGARYLGGRGAMDSHQAEISVDLVPRNRRPESQWAIMERLREQVQALPGVTLGVFQEQGGTARATTAAPIIVEINGTEPQALAELAAQTVTLLQAVGGVRDPYRNWDLDRPETLVVIDRERAAELGLDGSTIAATVRRAMDGERVTAYRQRGLRDLDISLRYQPEDRRQQQDLENVVLPGPAGENIRLVDLANFEPVYGPRLVSRENFRRTLEVRAWTDGRRPLSQVVADLERRLPEIETPAGYSMAIGGEQQDLAEARGRLLRALGAAALAVYLLLMIQFRSSLLPLVIMTAIPLQFIGVAAALTLAGKYLSMPALLGIVLLVGIVVNNSIILADFILARRRQGMPLDQAVPAAVAARFRPVMMTALSTVAGMLPLALELAVGSERFSPIATVIIGGILASTLLTLVVIPVLMQLLLSRFHHSDQPRSVSS